MRDKSPIQNEANKFSRSQGTRADGFHTPPFKGSQVYGVLARNGRKFHRAERRSQHIEKTYNHFRSGSKVQVYRLRSRPEVALPVLVSVSAAFFALGGLLRCSARRRFVLPGTFVREENGTYVTTKIRDSVAITVVSAVMLTAAANVHASELSRERLLAVRTQEEFATLYKIISRKVGDDANRIVESLEKNGFSCRMGKTLFKAQCVFAYCGDRRLFLPTLPQRELMTINVTIERNDGVWTGVAHHQTACPETDVVLKQKQEDLLTGGTPRGGKK